MFSAFIAVLLFTTCDRSVVENDGISVECMELNDFELLYSDIKQLTNDHITNDGVQTRGIFGKILACVLADGFKSSSLSKEDKLRLNDVVSVTYASSALWNSKISLK